MIRLSANVLCLIQKLLIKINTNKYSDRYDFFAKYSIPVNDVLSIATQCKWISINDKNIELTLSGNEILTKTEIADYLGYRLIIQDYIKYCSPIWKGRIPFGRNEVTPFLTKDEKACFYEANLLNAQPQIDTIIWWDKMAQEIREDKNKTNIAIGRTGESLSINFEYNRTTRQPIWESIDSNLLGYDIISSVSEENTSKLLIEVKTSEKSIDYADFFISKNEWNKAKMSNFYCFHLWMVYNNQKRLAIIKPQQIAKYIPTNNDVGEWESVRIPFSEFKELFFIVNNKMEVVNGHF